MVFSDGLRRQNDVHAQFLGPLGELSQHRADQPGELVRSSLDGHAYAHPPGGLPLIDD